MHNQLSSKINRALRFLKNTWLISYLSDPLRNNAVFLIGASASNALIGFFFWMLAARLYPAEDVGRATALISAGMMLAMFSGLGMGMGVIRFLAEEKNKNLLINTTMTVVSSIAFLLSIIFILGINSWSPALDFIKDNYLLLVVLIIFTIFTALSSLLNSLFIAFRTTRYSFYQSLIVALKIIILILLVGRGTGGIFLAYTLGMTTAFVVASLLIHRLYDQYRLRPTVNVIVIKNIFRFSFQNYIGDLFRSLPGVIMPLIIVNLLGASMNAYFYVAWMLSGLFFTVSYSISFSLTAAIAYNPDQLRHQIYKAIKFALYILMPAIIAMYFLGSPLLSLFGMQYAQEATGLLQLLVVSSIPMAINEIFIAILRIRKTVKPVIYIYAFIALFTIIVGNLLLGLIGINAIGIAWLAANTITMLVIVVINLKNVLPKMASNY